MTELKNVNKKIIMILGGLSYFGSYITRVNLSAIIEELVSRNIFSKDTLAFAVTCNVIVYGIGLVIAGVLTNRFQPKNLLFMSLTVVALMNLMIPFCNLLFKESSIIVAWGINGFAQALMWPALIKVYIQYLNPKEYETGIFFITTGSSLGAILTYLFAPIVSKYIGADGWQFMFFIPAGFATILGFVWLFSKYSITIIPKEKRHNNLQSKIFTPMIAAIAFVIIIQGILRDGITTWMPTYINDIFRLGPSISILSGVALPLFGVFSSWVSVRIIRKLKNPILSAFLIYAVASIFCITLRVFSKNIIVAIFSMAIIVGCMNGVNMMLVSMVPKHYANTGKGAMLSGILNAFTYVGSAVSIYGIVLFSSAYGWMPTVSLWAGISIIGTVICFSILPVWNKRFGEE